MTRTIPRNLKKKLQASLENLTPRQAGRLFLILFHEADKKGVPVRDYKPLDEVDEACWRQVETASKKGYEAQAQRHYRGYLFLRNLVHTTNQVGFNRILDLLTFAYRVSDTLGRLLVADLMSDLAHQAEDKLRDLPWPVTPEEYGQIVAYSQETQPLTPEEVVEWIVEPWAEEELGDEYYVDTAFGLAHNPDRRFFIPLFETPELRQAWVADQGDKLLQEVFAGNRDDLEAWVEFGGFIRDADRKAKEAKEEEVVAHLDALVEAGDIEAKPTAYLTGCYGNAPIVDGAIPAWAALLHVWAGWLYDRGLRIREDFEIDPRTIAGVFPVYRLEDGDDLTDDDLAAVAGDFLTYCKKRPWGRNLPAPKSVDLAALGLFLTSDSHPIQAAKAPDLGRVDWEVFRQAEGEDGRLSDPVTLVRIGDLKAKAEALGTTPDVFSSTWIEEAFYPTDKPEDHRRKLKYLLKPIREGQIKKIHVPRMGETKPVGDIVGEEFAGPLLQVSSHLFTVKIETETLKLVLRMVSDEYFDGLPVLAQEPAKRLAHLEEVVGEAYDDLRTWVRRYVTLGAEPTELEIPTTFEPDQDKAKEFFDTLVAVTLADAGVKKGDFDLGPKGSLS